MATASIKEVARHAGVSLGTVSNVLNRPEVVSDQTRSRVIAAIEELRYVRNDSANDLLALGLLREMTRRGLRVPGDVAIVGHDDIDFAAAAAVPLSSVPLSSVPLSSVPLSSVPLSSVRQPRARLGRTAAELLLREANEPEHHEHRHVVFEPELVARESTARARAARGQARKRG
jgi:LacI family transcriptional regulator, galactose operon repressor